jgi:capsular polysaccharide biosynthesis protein
MLANEADLLALAERAGFSRFVPGELSFPDQIRHFAEASHVIAAHGAGLAGIAFCHRDAAVCELRPQRSAAPVYRHLAAVRRLRYGSLTGEAADDEWWLEPQAFEAVLDDPRFSSG